MQLVWSVVPVILVAVLEGLKGWDKLITYVNAAACDGKGKKVER